MKRSMKKILKYAVILLLIALYLNALPYLVTTFDMEYTVYEFILILAAIILAVLTSEWIFRAK
ncbi:hypothetical protein FZC78_19595 [Rossellomorea vietnamensis]|uniref:Uncharacterized protein n=1 Tax=Rossellomorea vietnamensis TaxID=218284 RepID=A0A5D4NJN7_9BACI|nr:hypothetical protein [Rossellomorea vietnamensis]TYS14059.1 hypothetical protein FZC78_19595 [Rossellomorea vietnamensis]